MKPSEITEYNCKEYTYKGKDITNVFYNELGHRVFLTNDGFQVFCYPHVDFPEIKKKETFPMLAHVSFGDGCIQTRMVVKKDHAYYYDIDGIPWKTAEQYTQTELDELKEKYR